MVVRGDDARSERRLCGKNVTAFQACTEFLLEHRPRRKTRRNESYRTGLWGPAWECVMTDIEAEIRDSLAFHLGADQGRLTADARLAEDLGAASLYAAATVMPWKDGFTATMQ